MSARFFLWALPLIAAASAASAQLAPSISGFSDAPTTATEDEYWFFMRELGRCLSRSKPGQSVAFLQTKIATADEKRAFDALINRRGNNPCMSNMVRATVVRAQVRGSIAEGLYKAQVASASQPAVPPGLSGPATIRSIHDFADCYVATNYSAARSLLDDTKLGTKEENRRVREMAAGFGSCLPAGREVRIVATDIRLALAEALYRATVNRPAALQGSN